MRVCKGVYKGAAKKLWTKNMCMKRLVISAMYDEIIFQGTANLSDIMHGKSTLHIDRLDMRVKLLGNELTPIVIKKRW